MTTYRVMLMEPEQEGGSEEDRNIEEVEVEAEDTREARILASVTIPEYEVYIIMPVTPAAKEEAKA